jgi:hypothetical protein
MRKAFTELTKEVRAEFERHGASVVLKKLDQAGVGRGALVYGFDCGDIQRSVVEDWLAQQERRQQDQILFWARIAGIGTIISIVLTLLLWVAGILLGNK